MTSDISSILNNKQLPVDRSVDKTGKKLSIESVDRLADELVKEYSNVKYRSWYCKVIYEFGISQVLEWRIRAQEGREPAKLFSKYAKEAVTFRAARSSQNA